MEAFPGEGVPCVLFLTKEGKEKEAYLSSLPKGVMEAVERALCIGRPYCDGKTTFLFADKVPLILYGLGCKPATLDRI
jgi:hypothetical protein